VRERTEPVQCGQVGSRRPVPEAPASAHGMRAAWVPGESEDGTS
jgi:hypothetical protein